MKRFFVLMFMLALSAGVYARQLPMDQPPRVLLTENASSVSSAEQVKTMILNAATRFGWMVIGNDPGKITLQYNKSSGKHIVTIAVEYDSKSYQIKYVDSVNMNYELENGIAQIHPNYNRWIFNLNKEISNQQYLK